MSQSGLRSIKSLKPVVLRGRDLEIATSTTEIQELQKQKSILLQDIKKLGGVFFGLRKAKEAAEEGFDDYATGRIMALEYIAREVSGELKVMAEEISERAKAVEDTRKRLDLIRIDLVKREKALGTEAERLASGASALAKSEVLLNNRQQKLSQAEGELSGRMGIIARKEGETSAFHNKVKKLASFLEVKADKERHRLDVWAKTLAIREKRVASAKRAFKRIEKTQEERGLWLLDREGALSRTMSEIKKRESDIIKHGR